MRPYLTYYKKENIAPVSQDIADLKKHFERREALYRLLGIAPRLVQGRSILEFGPGTGHNSIYTISLLPEYYLLVDANPLSLSETTETLKAHTPRGVTYEVKESIIEEFSSDRKFDLVLCEGVIPYQMEPSDFFQQVASHATPGGIIVTTCVDPVSFLPEILRRLIVAMVLPDSLPVDEKVRQLLPIFSPHLNTLKGMSRNHEDWIMDVVLHPLIGKPFSIADAIEAADETMDFYNSSPQILLDWRWYKDIHGKQSRYNEMASQAYVRYLHCLADYSSEFSTKGDREDNIQILQLCSFIERSVLGGPKVLSENLSNISDNLHTLIEIYERALPNTALALRDYLKVFDAATGGTILSDWGAFTSLFGRGQQYVSFIQRQNDD